MSQEMIVQDEDIKEMLDHLLEEKGRKWWDEFYADKDRIIPFCVSVPDENLVQMVDQYSIEGGRALDLGCGNGRNAFFLGQRGCEVTAIDLSTESIRYAEAHHSHGNITYHSISFFDIVSDQPFDLIYDAGCLHHIPPHRRPEYLSKISGLLAEGGLYGLSVFNEDGGSGLTDYQVYREGGLKGGLGFSRKALSAILAPYFDIKDFRRMREIPDGSAFGKDFLWNVLLEKKTS